MNLERVLGLILEHGGKLTVQRSGGTTIRLSYELDCAQMQFDSKPSCFADDNTGANYLYEKILDTIVANR